MGRVCNLVHKGFAKKNADTLLFSNSNEISNFAKNDQFFAPPTFIL